MESFLWIVVLGAVVCFLTAFAIGANDVANTFSTSVGSRAITLSAAICMAAILETLGATLLGGAVTDSIRSKIIDFNAFRWQPSILMLGMLCSLLGAGLWLFLANAFGLPVSTTHSIIGALLGFGLASGTPNAVHWKQLGLIVGSWLVAPLAASALGGCTFFVLRKFVLRNAEPLKAAKRWDLIGKPLFRRLFEALAFFRKVFLKIVKGVRTTRHPCAIGLWAEAHVGASLGVVFALSCFLAGPTSFFVYRFASFRLKRHRRRIARSQKQEADTFGATPPQLSEAVRHRTCARVSSVLRASLEKFLSGSSVFFCFKPVFSSLCFYAHLCMFDGIAQFGRHSVAAGDCCEGGVDREVSIPSPSASVVALRIAASSEGQPQKASTAAVSQAVSKGRGADESRCAMGEEEEIGRDADQGWPNVACNPDSRELSVFSLRRSSDEDTSSTLNRTLPNTSLSGKLRRCWRRMPWFKDLHAEGADEDAVVAELQQGSEKFDVETEIFFSCCQIVSCCLGCVAHSANDTANAIGPFAALVSLHGRGVEGLDTPLGCPWYILFFGGLSMSLGLALLGYRVIKTVGVKLVNITPARGFAMELGAAWTVLLFSFIGIPLSTTHCAVGSTVGVGLLERQIATDSAEAPQTKRQGARMCTLGLNFSSVNWKLLVGVFTSWIITIVFSGVVSAALFSFAAYSPHIKRS